ncbi:hypothetical protein BCV71DRAFT_224740, partial [Rhizopus microsporus]
MVHNGKHRHSTYLPKHLIVTEKCRLDEEVDKDSHVNPSKAVVGVSSRTRGVAPSIYNSVIRTLINKDCVKYELNNAKQKMGVSSRTSLLGDLQHHGLLNHKARTSNAIESYHSALYTVIVKEQLLASSLRYLLQYAKKDKTDLLREFVAEDTLKESIEKHFKNPCNERKQKQKDYSELLEELLEEIRDLLIKDTDHEADEAVNKEYNVKKTSEQHAANIHQYNKTLRPNTANFCYIDSIFELLWHSAIPHFEEVILSKFDSHNKFDSILKTSYKWHRLNTDDGRNCVSYSLRKFVWENKISNR